MKPTSGDNVIRTMLLMDYNLEPILPACIVAGQND